MKTAIAIGLLLAASSALGEPLRTAQDPARKRVWVLEVDAVYLEEGNRRQRFELPGWVHAKDIYACTPDLAVDAQGAVVVTSNVVPVVWRIEPATAQVTRHELALDADLDKEVGFTSITYARHQRAFYAFSATYGSVWRIDPQLSRAQKVRQLDAPARECLPASSL